MILSSSASSWLPSYRRAYCLIDAAYVIKRLEGIDVIWQNVNLYKLAETAVRSIRGERGTWEGSQIALSRVIVYGAVPDADLQRTATPGPETIAGWLRRNDSLPDVRVRYGRLIDANRTRRSPARQKAVDILLAVDAVGFAARGLYDVLVLVAGDGDYVPIIEAVGDIGPLATVSVFRDGLAKDLVDAADRVGYLPSDSEIWRTSSALD